MRLHDPTSVPGVSDYGFVVSAGNEYFVPVVPRMVHADAAIHHVGAARRECFLADERRLAFFAHYTQENCFTECAANLTITMCGCVLHFLPHTAQQRVCGPSQVV
jgi:amiloride-sensitive sodium channel